jgi:hypothetical protein
MLLFALAAAAATPSEAAGALEAPGAEVPAPAGPAPSPSPSDAPTVEAPAPAALPLAPALPPPPADPEVGRLQRQHLVRLGVLSGASAVGGGVVAGLGWEDPRLQSAGLMTVGWAAVNTGIVLAAWKGSIRPRTPAELRQSRELLQLNLGLDIGYVTTGVAMGVLGHLDDRGAVEGAGWAIAAQGLGLAVLDGILLLELPR